MLATLLFDEDTYWSVERQGDEPDNIDVIIAHDNGKGDFWIIDKDSAVLELFKESHYSRVLGSYALNFTSVRLLLTKDTFDGILNDIQRVHDKETNACGKN